MTINTGLRNELVCRRADPPPVTTVAPQAIEAGTEAAPTLSRMAAGLPPTPQLEGYQIISRLGEGGMGVVWRAVQLSTRRHVALKLMSAAMFGSERARLRFDREVELTAKLEHPNIARVYDRGINQGVYFYAMELIEGLPLDTYVLGRRLDERQVLQLMSVICRAVQHAHQRGVIHRDLKPSNILVGDDGHPYLMDFGLAKELLADGSGSRISLDGEIAGTPEYMSPEQAAGRTDQLDTRTDVYSLGVILYQLLTRHSPHDMTGSRLQLLRRIAEQEVVPPRQRCCQLDRKLEALLLKALEREPERRYGSAGELAADIDHYLAGEPLTARPRRAFWNLLIR